MKRLRYFLILMLAIAFSGHAQRTDVIQDSDLVEEDFFRLQLVVDHDIQEFEIDEYRKEVDEFITSLKMRHRRSTKSRMIEDMFYRGHSKFLKHYTELTTFNELMSRGKYDCLTATIFYSYCLSELGVDYTIVETPHHIFLRIKDSDILLETTDPINGFAQGAAAVEKRLAEDYEEMDLSAEVGFRETIGLQHYNAAVDAFNEQQYLHAVDHVVQSSRYYEGPRLIKIGLILSRAISSSDFSEDVKFEALLKLTRTLDSGVQMAGIN